MGIFFQISFVVGPFCRIILNVFFEKGGFRRLFRLFRLLFFLLLLLLLPLLFVFPVLREMREVVVPTLANPLELQPLRRPTVRQMVEGMRCPSWHGFLTFRIPKTAACLVPYFRSVCKFASRVIPIIFVHHVPVVTIVEEHGLVCSHDNPVIFTTFGAREIIVVSAATIVRFMGIFFQISFVVGPFCRIILNVFFEKGGFRRLFRLFRLLFFLLLLLLLPLLFVFPVLREMREVVVPTLANPLELQPLRRPTVRQMVEGMRCPSWHGFLTFRIPKTAACLVPYFRSVCKFASRVIPIIFVHHVPVVTIVEEHVRSGCPRVLMQTDCRVELTHSMGTHDCNSFSMVKFEIVFEECNRFFCIWLWMWVNFYPVFLESKLTVAVGNTIFTTVRKFPSTWSCDFTIFFPLVGMALLEQARAII